MSARIPETNWFYIPTRRSPGLADENRLLVIDTDGKLLSGEGTPNSEFWIHARIYAARPEVNGICHAHPLACISLTQIGEPHRVVHNQGGAFADGVPEYGRIGLDPLARAGRRGGVKPREKHRGDDARPRHHDGECERALRDDRGVLSGRERRAPDTHAFRGGWRRDADTRLHARGGQADARPDRTERHGGGTRVGASRGRWQTRNRWAASAVAVMACFGAAQVTSYCILISSVFTAARSRRSRAPLSLELLRRRALDGLRALGFEPLHHLRGVESRR